MSLSNTSTTLTRSDIWFDDGNIVLVAGSYAFKVHRGQLQRHSEVFDGMFHIPQPNEQNAFDGCPLVDMFDSPDDLHHFLSAFYDGLYFSAPRPVHFARMAAVLRLSSKYFVPHLRQQCLERLALDWPSTLQAWDSREREAQSTPKGCYAPRQFSPHPVLVIELAIELGLNHLLPSAFYDLSRYAPTKIMYGTPGIKSVLVSSSTEPRYVCLSSQLLVRTFLGRESGQRYLVDFLSSHVTCRKPSSDCLFSRDCLSHPCVQAFHEIRLNIFRSIGGIDSGRDADPLFSLAQAMELLTKPDRIEGERARALMCSPCKVAFLDDFARGRERAWMHLPSWFGLEEESKGEGWGGRSESDDHDE